jgi:predicted lipoprotein with Yx(FWY)xxD motif
VLAATGGLLAACGSSSSTGVASSSSGSGGTSSGNATASSSHTILAVKTVKGIGAVLVDSAGDTVYAAQQQANGKILCTGSCTSFWFPVTVSGGATLRAAGNVTGKLGTIHRPGGMTQLTINGRPLYTFRLDSAAGQVHGNDYTDHFGGMSFTWHAVTTSGSLAAATKSSDSGGSGGYGY